MGVSSATQPTPNKGYEAAAQQRMGLLLKMATEILPLAGATSESGKVLLDIIGKLSKVVQPGSNTQASERNAIDKMAMQNAQQSQMMKQMQPGMAQGGQGGPPGGAPPGAQGMAA